MFVMRCVKSVADFTSFQAWAATGCAPTDAVSASVIAAALIQILFGAICTGYGGQHQPLSGELLVVCQ